MWACFYLQWLSHTDKHTDRQILILTKYTRQTLMALRVSDVAVDPNQQRVVQKQFKWRDTVWTPVGFS